MANPNPLTLADWAWPFWTTTRDRTIAVTIGMVNAGHLDDGHGVFGQGGPPGEGPGQAAAAFAAWQARGWQAFPERNTGQAALFWPVAAAAVAERSVQKPAAAAVTVGGAVAGSVSDVPGAISGAVDKLTDGLAAVKWLTTPNAWVRITKVGIGIGLVFIGAGLISIKAVGTPFTNLIGKADDAVARQATLSP
jgi:hypothetical protein